MDHQELVPKEAELLLNLLRQIKGGVTLNPDSPDEAIEAAMLYKSAIEKLKAKAQEAE